MTTRQYIYSACASVVVMTLAACGGPSAPPSASIAQQNAADVHISHKHYKIDITYPAVAQTYPTLQRALETTAKTQKTHFLRNLPDITKLPRLANRQLPLTLHFMRKGETQRFVSVQERGGSAFGGAHPLPISRTFVYDKKADALIHLEALFQDPAAARKKLSKYARRRLESKILSKVPGGNEASFKARHEWTEMMRKMIVSGTQPSANKKPQFLILGDKTGQADSLRLVFPSYQVAPYSYGVQTVTIPTSAFSSFLKPAFKNSFN